MKLAHQIARAYTQDQGDVKDQEAVSADPKARGATHAVASLRNSS